MAAMSLGGLSAAGGVSVAAASVVAESTTIGQSDAAPDFYYDSATGDLRFYHDGLTPIMWSAGAPSYVVSLVVGSASGLLRFNNASPTFKGGAGATLSPTLLASSLSNGIGFIDGFDLGNVLPAGLASDILTNDLTLKYQVLNGGFLKKRAWSSHRS